VPYMLPDHARLAGLVEEVGRLSPWGSAAERMLTRTGRAPAYRFS
jgi:hypothetical protein